MGAITNQWLKGRVLKNRPHSPVSVTVTSRLSTQDEWAKSRSVIAEIFARRSDAYYQTVYITPDEVNKIVQTLFSVSNLSVQQDEAIKLLSKLSDSELVAVLAKAMANRGPKSTLNQEK